MMFPPLRQFSDEFPSKTPTSTRRPPLSHAQLEDPEARTGGAKSPPGAVIYYSLKEAPREKTVIEILDGPGNVVRKYSSNKTEDLDELWTRRIKSPEKEIKSEGGLNRFPLDLRYQGASHVPDYYLYEYRDAAAGPMAMPGKYQVRLTVDGKARLCLWN